MFWNICFLSESSEEDKLLCAFSIFIIELKASTRLFLQVKKKLFITSTQRIVAGILYLS